MIKNIGKNSGNGLRRKVNLNPVAAKLIVLPIKQQDSAMAAEMRKLDGSSSLKGPRLNTSLKNHYETIGRELLRYESASATWRLQQAESILAQFRAGLSFVPVEVLESYLDDLLDLHVSDRMLSIERQFGSIMLSLASAVILILTGTFYAALAGAPYFQLLALSLSTILIAVLIWQHFFHPASRRLKFVHILSKEISRRRGQHGNGSGLTLRDVALSSLVAANGGSIIMPRGLIH